MARRPCYLAHASTVDPAYVLSLHIPTLLLAIVMGFALLGLALVMVQRNTMPGPELRLWTAGVWAFLIGFAFVVTRVACLQYQRG